MTNRTFLIRDINQASLSSAWLTKRRLLVHIGSLIVSL